jgi:N-acetylmuramoyl-L-alanine amidase
VFAQEKVTQDGDGKPIIIFDPGHGGRDPGAVGARGTMEKTIVFAFSQALKRKLEVSSRYQVHMTREGDGFLKLPWRIFSARQLVRNQAARSLFISIHADSVPSGFSRSASGASVYVYSEEPSDRETMLRAINENQKTGGVKIDSQMTRQRPAGHMINGSERQRRHRSTLFATGLLGELGGTTDLRWKHPRSANFTVLTIPDVPAALIELGYISNQREEKLLGSEPWREDMAAAVSRAIDAYFLKIGALNPGAAQAGQGASNQ